MSVRGVDIERQVRELGGAAGRGLLGRSGTVRREVDRLVREGRLVRHPGPCFAVPDADPDIVRARQFAASLTCLSAARAHGFDVWASPAETHLAVAHGRGNHRNGALHGARVIVHREAPALLTAAPHPAVPGGCGPLVIAPAEALARALRCLPEVAAIVAVDSALNRAACTVADIASLLLGPGSPTAKAVLAECDGRSQSPAESVARVALRRAGFSVEANCFIEGVGYVDLLVEGKVVVECDGYAYHADLRAFAGDRRRDRALQVDGWVVLRFPAGEVLRDPAAVVACVRAVLESRLPSGGPRDRRRTESSSRPAARRAPGR